VNNGHYILIGLFIALLFFKPSRSAAKVILVGYLIYLIFILPIDGPYYYKLAALLNMIIGFILYKEYRIVALLSFSLILVNSVGLVLYNNYYEPTIYDNLSLLIIALQILILIARVTLNGIHARGVRGRALVFLINFDSIKSSVTMQGRQKKG